MLLYDLIVPDNPRHLPGYNNPPVTEVVLGVQFDPIANIRSEHLVLLWKEYRERFPNIEEHPPLNSTFESFEPGPRKKEPIQIQLIQGQPPSRRWFLSSEGDELIQVQFDRFVVNWRSLKENHAYPRFEHVRDVFLKEFDIFSAFIKAEELGDINFNQCEITYVNQIKPEEVWGRFGQLNKVFTVWENHYSDSFLNEPEDARFDIKYIIPGPEGHPIGRMHISINSAYLKSDGSPIFTMNLACRGKPLGEGIEGVIGFFQTGREWIVSGFTSITTTEMHEAWERKNDK